MEKDSIYQPKDPPWHYF
ncbi:hypothetical protein AYI68_g1107, partial [Smittium mucronatum]